MEGTTVLVVDGQTLDRELMCSAIANRAGMSVHGAAATTSEALHSIEEASPDVVLLKSFSPGVDSIGIIHRIKEAGVVPRVLVVGAVQNDAYLMEVVRAGANGYLPMTSSIDDLLSSLERVVRGGTTFDASSASELILAMARRSPESRADALSARETDVLRLIAKGYSSKEIGVELGVSPRTVDCHRMKMMQKLRVHKVADLVRYAVREGIVSVWDENRTCA
jgi:DNA-binding NarL/FixJ family response regulator